MKKSLLAATISGAIGLASPGFAQDINGGAGTAVAPERVIVTREVVVTRGIDLPRLGIAPVEPATLSGGVGGAIGGYYINGATPAGNLPINGTAWPYR